MMNLKPKDSNKFILIVLLSITCYKLHAQQTALFSEYNFNPFIINPAYAGSLSSTEVTLANTGFSSFEGAPRNLNASFHTPLKEGQIGVGGAFIRDKVGVTNTTQALAAYSYKIFFDFNNSRPYWQSYEPGVLSFGITAGILQFQEDLLSLGITDDVNFSENINASIPTVGAGILFSHARFYAGVSSPNLIGLQLASDSSLNTRFPVFGYFGYRFYNNRFEDFVIKPSLFLRHEAGAPLLVDLNVSVNLKKKFELGVGYRSTSSVNLLAGFYIAKSLRLVYHYNVATSNNSPVGNTHGVIISVRFNNGYKNSL